MSVTKRVWSTTDGGQREAWVVRYSTFDRDARGKRKRHISTFAKKRDADSFAATVHIDVARGVHVPASKSPTVAEAGVAWLDACRELERATVDSYRAHVNLHIVPYIGGIKLGALTVAAIRDWQDKLRRGDPEPGRTQGESRSSDMIRRATISLGALLADAQERGQVAQNVVRSLRANRRRGKERQAERRANAKLKVGVDIPTPAEIDAMLGAAEGRWRPFLLVATRCGLRSSELRGLTWKDIDFKKAELHVRQRADKYNVVGSPKSESSQRAVPIPPSTLNALREWRLVCPRGELVFPNGAGNIESHSNILQRGFMPTMIAAGVVDSAGKAKYSGLHSLRHFYASWSINRRSDGGLEMPLKVVSERLGHSSVTLTADRYSHLFPRGDDSAELAAAEGKHG